VANLPPVSTTPAELAAKFTAGVVDTRANLPLVFLIPAAILPAVSLTSVANLPPVVHFHLQISH
jgi:hypothetical protein